MTNQSAVPVGIGPDGLPQTGGNIPLPLPTPEFVVPGTNVTLPEAAADPSTVVPAGKGVGGGQGGKGAFGSGPGTGAGAPQYAWNPSHAGYYGELKNMYNPVVSARAQLAGEENPWGGVTFKPVPFVQAAVANAIPPAIDTGTGSGNVPDTGGGPGDGSGGGDTSGGVGGTGAGPGGSSGEGSGNGVGGGADGTGGASGTDGANANGDYNDGTTFVPPINNRNRGYAMGTQGIPPMTSQQKYDAYQAQYGDDAKAAADLARQKAMATQLAAKQAQRLYDRTDEAKVQKMVSRGVPLQQAYGTLLQMAPYKGASFNGKANGSQAYRDEMARVAPANAPRIAQLRQQFNAAGVPPMNQSAAIPGRPAVNQQQAVPGGYPTSGGK